MSVIAFIAAAAAAILIVRMVYRRIKYGGSCCGGEQRVTEARIRSADSDISHYPYHYTAEISGMICSQCVRNVENAFNSADGIYAAADLGKKCAVIHSKRRLERREAAAVLDSAGYTLTDFKEEHI